MKHDKVTYVDTKGRRHQVSRAKLSTHLGGIKEQGGIAVPNPEQIKPAPRPKRKR